MLTLHGRPRTVSEEPTPGHLALRRDGSIDPLQQFASRARYTDGQAIFMVGDDKVDCFKVVRGAVRLCSLLADGRRLIAHFLLPGDFFGFNGLAAPSLTAEAIGPVELTRYPSRAVALLASRDPEIARRLHAMVCRQLTAAESQLLVLGRMTPPERLAFFLLELAEHGGAELGDTAVLDLPMSRQDIADYLGLTIETVSRTFTLLKRKGVLALPKPQHVVLSDVEALRDLAAGD